MPKIYRRVIANVCYLEEMDVDQETFDRLETYLIKEREFYRKDWDSHDGEDAEGRWLDNEMESFDNSLYDRNNNWKPRFPTAKVDVEEDTHDVGSWGTDKEELL